MPSEKKSNTETGELFKYRFKRNPYIFPLTFTHIRSHVYQLVASFWRWQQDISEEAKISALAIYGAYLDLLTKILLLTFQWQITIAFRICIGVGRKELNTTRIEWIVYPLSTRILNRKCLANGNKCDGRESNIKVFHRNRKRWNYVFCIYYVMWTKNCWRWVCHGSLTKDPRWIVVNFMFSFDLVTFSYAIRIVVRYRVHRERTRTKLSLIIFDWIALKYYFGGL